MEGVYQSELLLQLRISFQHAWATEDDPYTATNAYDLLDEFIEHWNANFAAEQDYDLAHLWTDRERTDGAIVGLAHRSVVCSGRSFSYGMSKRRTELPDKYVTPAHEIGHNFGATHPEEAIPPITTCINTAMRGGIFGGGNPQLTFCQFSRQEIAEYVAGNNSCLGAQEITLHPPTGLTATATSESSISLAWQDNSTNETGFIVPRRREGSGVWIRVGTTAANVATLSSSGLFSSATYIFRVQAFNDEESSAYSNEDEATTLAGQPPVSDWIIDTIAGRRDEDDENGPALQARLGFPQDVAVDRSGNVYIAESESHRVRRVDTNGTITTVAGTGKGGYGGDGGPADAALLWGPNGVAVDSAGNLYISDNGNGRIRRVDGEGIITTVAGNGMGGYGGDGGPAVEAGLYGPRAVAVDGAGNLYITQTVAGRIRRVDTAGIITTVATGVRSPRGLAVDRSGNLYIADRVNYRIRRVDGSGIIATIAGIGESGYGGDGGPANQAQLYKPKDATVDNSGNLYIADTYNHRIRRVDTSGIITTIAGNGHRGHSGDGGPALEAELSSPESVAVDNAGNLYIADTYNHRVRRVDPQGNITTVTTQPRYPSDVAVDGTGNLYIADTQRDRVLRVDGSGNVTTVAGTRESGYSGDGGPANAAQLDSPRGVAVDGAGNLYIADTGNNRIRRVDGSGIITTFAGSVEGYDTRGYGPAVEATLYSPVGVAVDKTGNLYISEDLTKVIRRVDGSGIMTTIAGTGKRGPGGDGGPALEAEFHWPSGLAVDNSGNVYVADTENHRVRVLTRASSFPPPTHLKATAVSFQEIKLTWNDNSADETGFRIQRWVGGSARWVGVGTTAANATSFSDTGLEPNTTYHYRVRALKNVVPSAFSNEAMATTPKPLPPTLTRFSPTSGPVGIEVTITGTHFLGATAVRFNEIPAARFEVVSETSIEAVVPLEGTSGPISVETLGGAAASAEPFTVTDTGIHSRLFVPTILRSQGRTPGSFFTSELTLTNRGTTTASVSYTNTAAFGGGSGTAVDSLEAGRQRVIPDAIAFLTSLGVPIGSGSAGGTLVVDFSNLSSPSDAAVTVRVSTPVEEGSVRAGLAYPGLNPDGLLTGPSFITGLRQNRQDRSNLAVQNAGVVGEESITLRVTVFSGDPASAVRSVVLPDLSLPPGGFHQFNGILDEAGFDNGYVKVEPVAGTAPYFAYGVINDNFNSDGSFVFPVREDSLEGKRGQTLPVVLETGDFTSELTVTNFSLVPKTVDFRFVAEAVETDDDTASFSLKLEAGEQRIVPQVIEWLRRQEVAGIGPANRAFVGALSATVAEGDMSGIVIGARTGAPDQRGGQYSLFYNGVPFGSASVESAWIYGLQQNAENRSNLALVNTGEIDDSSSTFEITIYDGSKERQPRTSRVTLGPRRWTQENGILGKIRQGYVQVRKTSGDNPFVTYGVVNDGGKPGERSGDGAFLPAQE